MAVGFPHNLTTWLYFKIKQVANQILHTLKQILESRHKTVIHVVLVKTHEFPPLSF